MESTSDQTTSVAHSRMAPNYGGLRSKFPLIGDIIPGDILNNIQGTNFQQYSAFNIPFLGFLHFSLSTTKKNMQYQHFNQMRFL